MKPTPGPWKVAEKETCSVVDSQGHVLAVASGHMTTIPEDEANAQLIAASVDLLEACKAINAWCSTDDAEHALPYEPPWYRQLLAAIEKAEGR